MLVDLLADGQHRIERRQRLLRDEGDVLAEQALPLCRRHRDEIVAAERQAASGHGKARRQHLRNGAADHRLAGAGLADQSEHLSGLEREIQIVQHRRHFAVERGRDGEIACDEEAHARCVSVSRTSSVRRRPSPSTLKPNTVTKIIRIGNTRFHGRLVDRVPRVGDHLAPGRRVRADAQADERQDRLDDHRDAHFETDQRDQQRHGRGQRSRA